MPLVVNKKDFWLGVVFTATFLILLYAIHHPAIVSIQGKSVVNFSDEMFVSVSKGSVYFIPEMIEKTDNLAGRPFDVEIKADPKTALLLKKNQANVESKNGRLRIRGDLGEFLRSVLKDSDAVFTGRDQSLYDKYGYAGKAVAHDWWKTLKEMEGTYKKAKRFEEIKLLETVRVKALEPAYNFYGVKATHVSEHALGIGGIIVFYVIYTVWWGFAIYFLCEGVGLMMKKSKEKKEA